MLLRNQAGHLTKITGRSELGQAEGVSLLLVSPFTVVCQRFQVQKYDVTTVGKIV